MAFPSTPILDNFWRPDEGPPPSANWTSPATIGPAGFVVLSSQCAVDPASPGATADGYWNTVFGPDSEVYIIVATRQDDGYYVTLYARTDAGFSVGYGLDILRDDGVGDSVILWSVLSGNLSTYNITYQDGDSFGLQLIGSSISVYYKPVGGVWTLLGTSVNTDTDTAGYIGVYAATLTTRLDNFGGGGYIDTAGYSVITPDGVTFNLSANGLGVNPGIPDGFGFPPITHRTSKLYRSAGALLNGIDIEPRIVTITISAIAGSQDALHAVRALLWSALRWNRTLNDPPPPSRLRYTANGKIADLYVHYLSDVQGNAGGATNLQLIGIRLIAYDPMWYSTEETNEGLSFIETLDISYIVGKVDNAWTDMGSPTVGGSSLAPAVYAIVADDTYIYVGGDFLDWAGIAGADNIVRYEKATGTWSAMATGVALPVRAIGIGPDGTVYIGGEFINAGGDPNADYFARWDGAAWVAQGAVPLNSWVVAIAFAQDGTLYIGGPFTNAGGDADADRIAKWDGAAWVSLNATPLNDAVCSLVFGKDGTLYIGGYFTDAGGDPNADFITKWNGGAFLSLGTNPLGGGFSPHVNAMVIDKSGCLYVCGAFLDAGGDPNADFIAKWNGATWQAVGTPANFEVFSLAIDESGNLYVGGIFTNIGGIDLADRVAMWNGSAWNQLDIDLPGNPIVYAIAIDGPDIYFGFDTAGAAEVSGQNQSVVVLGDFETFPIITITGPGTLQHIINETSGEQLVFDLYINAGETITIDLSPGVKSITSDWPIRPGNAIGLVLPQSDLGTWSLKHAPIAPLGVNTISVFMTDTTGATSASIRYYNRWLSADEACK